MKKGAWEQAINVYYKMFSKSWLIENLRDSQRHLHKLSDRSRDVYRSAQDMQCPFLEGQLGSCWEKQGTNLSYNTVSTAAPWNPNHRHPSSHLHRIIFTVWSQENCIEFQKAIKLIELCNAHACISEKSIMVIFNFTGKVMVIKILAIFMYDENLMNVLTQHV